ncbi:HHR023Cp [Eremothecium sinecaudum]|uniref:ER membrane protein complex subunit 6 n=1 Tax=Eremothecium sinecaudum TaxID=45286 RepID=A0A0X8HWG6_9SACH|nr:HHR023Cp [Eremothecium sinecaudum]AMD22792.1 HHR023Cp [Eremothecium sinecaudum]
MNAIQDGIHQLKSPRSITFNNKQLRYVQDMTTLAFGCGAGILQLESLEGFAMFFVSYIAVGFLFMIWLCQGEPSKYFSNPVQDVFFSSLVRELAGFIMAWTFVYALLG